MFHELLFAVRSGHAYWRSVPFSQIAELYASRFLRIVAQNLVDAFVTVYLYQEGYSLAFICLLLGFYFLHRVLWSYLAAHIIAWLGPKASLLLSNIIAIPALVSLALIGTFTVGATISYLVFEGISLTILAVATDVQFSSIKHDQKAGSELGWLYIAEKIGAAVAPTVGGFLAFRFGPEAIMWIASFVMVIAALPLLVSPESTRRRQRVTYHGFDWHSLKVQMLSPTVRGADFVVSGGLWSLFIAIVVFGTGSNAVYAQLGVLFSISFVASIIVSWVYGLLIDRNKGERLLRFGASINVLIHATRPFVTTPVSVGMINVANEAGTSAYSMPTVRGQYDVVEELPGYRTVYFSVAMMFFCAGASCITFVAAGLVSWLGDINGLKAIFWIMATLVPLIMIHGFKTLRPLR
jgi:MFS family permease